MSSGFVFLFLCVFSNVWLASAQTIQSIGNGTPKYQIGNCKYVDCPQSLCQANFDGRFVVNTPAVTCGGLCWNPRDRNSPDPASTTVAVGMQQGQESVMTLSSNWVHVPGQ
jgi:hypothetical protein